MKRVLLTVSGTIAPDLAAQVDAGTRPRPDYIEMARAFDADLLDFRAARERTGRAGQVIERIAGAKALLAYACFRARKRYDIVFTDGEQIGLPYAALCRFAGRGRARHLMIVHLLSVRKKVLLYKALRLGGRIDRFFVYATAQKRFLEDELGVNADRVVLTSFMVDTQFFAPDAVPAQSRRMICSAGLELRDYPTLLDAVRDLDVDVVIAAGSRWSKRPDEARATVTLPDNVEVTTLDYADLRQLYADAAFVVMPLYENDFQAGVTTMLEAMAMGKALICSRTSGQTDVIVDGDTGLYTRPGDVEELREQIQRLLDDPELAHRLGAHGRSWVESNAEVTVYAERLAHYVR